MTAIRYYFVFIILVIGTVLADPVISEEDKTKFIKNVYERHNHYRGIHDAERLSLFNDLVIMMRDDKINNHNFFRERIWEMEFVDGSNLTKEIAFKVVDDWYQTSEGYNYDIEPSTNAADPFTQIVWKNTKSIFIDVGVGGNTLYVIAFYYPGGNIENQYIANVGRPQTVQGEESISRII